MESRPTGLRVGGANERTEPLAAPEMDCRGAREAVEEGGTREGRPERLVRGLGAFVVAFMSFESD